MARVWLLDEDDYEMSVDEFHTFLERVVENVFHAEHAKGLLRLMDVYQAIWSDIAPTDETDRLDQQRVKGIIEWKE